MVGVIWSDSVADGAGSDHTATGWTNYGDNSQTTYGVSRSRYGVFGKFRTASEPSSYTFSHSTIQADRAVYIFCFRGVNPTNPFTVLPLPSQFNVSGTTTGTFVSASAALNSIGICVASASVVGGGGYSSDDTWKSDFTPTEYENFSDTSKYGITQNPFFYRNFNAEDFQFLGPAISTAISNPLSVQPYVPQITWPAPPTTSNQLHFMLAPAPIVVTDINTTETWTDGDTNIPITGTGMHRRGSN